MSASMAEVLRKTFEDHRMLWELDLVDGEVVRVWRCKSCGYLSVELETWEHQSNVASEVLAANGYGKLEDASRLIRDLTDPDDCQFDHHGGCQAHGYLSLEPGEMCPQLEAKAWLHNNPYRRPE